MVIVWQLKKIDSKPTMWSDRGVDFSVKAESFFASQSGLEEAAAEIEIAGNRQQLAVAHRPRGRVT
ncbi:hypothetical protein [Jannaschia sp. 2305UL9-9]|uniref:hypothetical protein n=1 Tax=Jannaschia sp. 2305UL9-9 TaxID=3121638 RepID=UPI0035271FB1